MNKTAGLTLHLKSQNKCPRLRAFSGQAVHGVHLNGQQITADGDGGLIILGESNTTPHPPVGQWVDNFGCVR